jgi:hypothetical protein
MTVTKIASCCPVPDRKVVTSTGVGVTYMLLINTWNTLPESYQQRIYNAIHLDYVSSEVPLEEPEIRNTDRIIPVDTNCTDEELHFGMPGSSGHYQD